MRYLIDRFGVLLKPIDLQTDDLPTMTLPTITGVHVISGPEGRQVAEAQTVNQFLRLDPKLLSQLRSLHLEEPDGTRLYTQRGMEIRLGSALNLWRYRDLIAETLDRFDYLDLRFGQEVVVRRW